MSILNDEIFGQPHKMEEKGKIKIANGNFAISFFFFFHLTYKKVLLKLSYGIF